MIRKKSGFLTFCFSVIPGAGQMYMGFMKRGLSLMSAFFLLILLPSFFSIDILLLALPIVWFYAFLDTHNLRGMPDDEFYAMEDNYLFLPEAAKDKAVLLQGKFRNIFAALLIIFGISILWNNLLDLLDRILPEYVSDFIEDFGRYIPQLIIGLILIAAGIYLINGKKKALNSKGNDAFLEDKGGLQ